MRGHWILDQIWGRKLRRQTHERISNLKQSAVQVSRTAATSLIDKMAEGGESVISLGETTWGKPVRVPLEKLIACHALVTGGTGSGKTRAVLGIVKAMIDRLPDDREIGFGILDPKGDLFNGAVFLIGERLKELARHDPRAAEELRRRVIVLDFASADPVSPYGLLDKWPGADPDFFAASRAELLLDLLAGSDAVNLVGSGVLKKVMALLAESHCPATYIPNVLMDTNLLDRLVSACTDETIREYFLRQYPAVPKVTVAALVRRMDALFASKSVRLALSGSTAPDFRRYMDEGGRIVLVNCFGPSISRDVRRVLQSIVLSDMRQGIFSRRSPEKVFTVFVDEAQHCFMTPTLRDGMNDILTMSRSFGTFFTFLTQNIASAVHDARMLSSIYTNIRWAFALRGEPADCAFLKSALPVSGRRPRPRSNPFAEKTFCSPSEERGLVLDEISGLPDRTGWLWFRSEGCEAIPVRTGEVLVPSGQNLEAAVAPLKRDPTFGERISRTLHDGEVGERDKSWGNAPEIVAADADQTFAKAYRKLRGKDGGDA